MYLMSFMDRVSIGNARLYNMEVELNMPPGGNDYLLAVSVLFITYCVSQAWSTLQDFRVDTNKCSCSKHPPTPS
jgi:hypothetical protein